MEHFEGLIKNSDQGRMNKIMPTEIKRHIMLSGKLSKRLNDL